MLNVVNPRQTGVPEIIKMAPVIRELEKQGRDYFILHTGQHYSYNLDRVFFEQLRLPSARYNLEVGSGSQAEQTAKILTGTERVLQQAGITSKLIPVPRHLSSNCGVCIRVERTDVENARQELKAAGVEIAEIHEI